MTQSDRVRDQTAVLPGMQIAPRDFLSTTDGYLCAVLAWPGPDGRVEAWPRYTRHPQHGDWVKIDALPGTTTTGVRLLGPDDISHVFHTRARVAEIEQRRPGKRDRMEERAARFVALLTVLGVPHDAIGVTGSTLIGRHGSDSDLDITIHGRAAFHRARAAIARLVAADLATAIDDREWREVYARRAPTIDFATFVYHERRKQTRVMFDGVRVDLTMVSARDAIAPLGETTVVGRAVLDAIVVDATAAFDYPARLQIDHPTVRDIVIFTNTYVGQAATGETIRVAGVLEREADGRYVMVVGTSRSAGGEYIVVLRAATRPYAALPYDMTQFDQSYLFMPVTR